MPVTRVSILQMTLLVAVVAFGSLPLRDPSSFWIGMLQYLRVALVLYATFRARYSRGRAAAWWFGFASFGWASLMMYASELPFKATPSIHEKGYRDMFNIGGTIGRWMEDLGVLPRTPESGEVQYAEIARFWLTIGVAVCGGFLSLWVSSRSGRRDPA